MVSLDDPVSKLPKLPYTFPLLEADPRGTSGEKDEGSFILKATNGCFPGGVYNNEEATFRAIQRHRGPSVQEFSEHSPENCMFIPEQNWEQILSPQGTH